MFNRKKFFALILSVLMLLVLGNASAFAFGITVTNSSHTLTHFSGNNNDTAPARSNENFSVTFTATDVQGTVNWQLVSSNDIHKDYLNGINSNMTPEQMQQQIQQNTQYVQHLSSVQLSSSGNTATITGTLHQDSAQFMVIIMATDLDSNGSVIGDVNDLSSLHTSTYAITFQNQDYISSYGYAYGTPNENTTQQEIEELHVAIVEPISEDYKTDDLLQKLANNASIDRSEIQWLSADVINTAEPPEPTDKMRDTVKSDGYQFAAKLNTIKVSEDGYYAFMVTVSDDLVGTKVSDLKLYYAEPSDFLSSVNGSVETAFGLMPLINGVTGGLEVSNFLGVKLDTLPKQFLATMFLSASKSMTVYIVKILLVLLGGCNVGFGIAGTFVVGVVAVKFFKTRK